MYALETESSSFFPAVVLSHSLVGVQVMFLDDGTISDPCVADHHVFDLRACQDFSKPPEVQDDKDGELQKEIKKTIKRFPVKWFRNMPTCSQKSKDSKIKRLGQTDACAIVKKVTNNSVDWNKLFKTI